MNLLRLLKDLRLEGLDPGIGKALQAAEAHGRVPVLLHRVPQALPHQVVVTGVQELGDVLGTLFAYNK
jgi:hypothetical protein